MANANETSQHIRTLKHKRRVFKSQITVLAKYIEEFQDSATDRTKLRERVERLRKQFDAFNNGQDDLGQHEDFDETEAEREAVTVLYDDVIANAVRILDGLNSTQITNARIATDSPAPSTSTNGIGVHLPKVNLPCFDGRLEKWLTFKDAFLSLIHSHTGLTDVQRFNYLRLSVSGKAESVIESFTISEENYKAAWDQLVETYDNHRALILRHTSLLLNAPAMPDDSSDSINDLINSMQSQIRSLKSLGRSWEDIANDLITSIAIDRMGSDTRKAWEQTLTDTRMPNAADIFKHLRNASHQGKLHTIVTNPRQPKHSAPEAQMSIANRRSRVSKRAWEFTTPSNRNSFSPPSKKRTFITTTRSQTCKICNSVGHKVYRCPKFSKFSVDERWTAVRTAKLCENCLEPYHQVKACKAGQCRACNQRHNTMLHKKLEAPNSNRNA